MLEIGDAIARTGEVKRVKVLGGLAVLDQGEMDWKVIAIDVNDPQAAVMNDIQDVQTHKPGLLEATMHWLRYYKIPAGKKENPLAFGGHAVDAHTAMAAVDEAHAEWRKLLAGDTPEQGSTPSGGSYRVSRVRADAADASAGAAVLAGTSATAPPTTPDAAMPAAMQAWHYVAGRSLIATDARL